MEAALVKAFGWSLRDIDETDIESLLPFIFRMNATAGGGEPKRVYCDEVDLL
jgi:transketolase N-terminal domain/subunit